MTASPTYTTDIFAPPNIGTYVIVGCIAWLICLLRRCWR
jgi:hypothetical protein